MSRETAAVLTVIHDGDTVDDDERYSFRDLTGVVVGSAINDGQWIEAHQVRGHPGADQAAVEKAQAEGRQRRHLSHGLFHGNDPKISCVVAEVPRKGPPGTGVRPFADQDPVAPRHVCCVSHDFPNVLLISDVFYTGGAQFLVDEQRTQEIDSGLPGSSGGLGNAQSH